MRRPRRASGRSHRSSLQHQPLFRTRFLASRWFPVAGSRTIRDDRLLAKTLAALKPAIVVSGGAKGADHLAERWARRSGVETLIFHPDHKKYRHPYHHRNRLIVEACDMLVAFWDGHSSGTKYTIDYARRMGKPVTVIRF